MSDPTISLCTHLTEPEQPYGGVVVDNQAKWLCADCTVQFVERLAETTRPLKITRELYVDKEHVEAIAQALSSFRHEMRTTKAGSSLIRNRAHTVGRYLRSEHGLSTSKQPRFAKRHFNRDDGRGPSYKRTKFIAPVKEPKSLSSFSDVVVFNRRTDAL